MSTTGISATYDYFAVPVSTIDPAMSRVSLSVQYSAGAASPALGVCVLGTKKFTTSSHVYTASMRPYPTVETPNPSRVFGDRLCLLYYRAQDKAPIITYDWQTTDLSVAGKYRFQIKAVSQAGKVEFLPEILVSVGPSA